MNSLVALTQLSIGGRYYYGYGQTFAVAYGDLVGDNCKQSRGRGKGDFFYTLDVCLRAPADSRLAKTWGSFAMGRVHQVGSSAPHRRRDPGKRLRTLRLYHGLTLRAVEQASSTLSRKLRNSEFLLPASRLHEFETKNVVPSIHRLYTLSCVYEHEIWDLLEWYGIPRRRI